MAISFSKFVAFTLLLSISAKPIASFALQMQHKDSVVQINPPLLGFYAKYVNSDGIPVRSANVVDDKALLIASSKVRLMLKDMPAARQNLIINGSELHIIGKDQQTSDLPEFSDQKGVQYLDNGVMTDIDKRTRGMGGVYASCGEENLLRLPTDRYKGGSDICIHEFAHTIMDFGLDNTIRQRIELQRLSAAAKGLWKGAYASTNQQEYWAELSMWYFGFHGEFLKGTKLPAPGAEGLRDYDKGGYALLDSIYSCKIQPNVIRRKASMVVLKGEKSVPSQDAADLAVINNSSGTIKLYWINWDGKPVLYQSIPAHSHFVQATFILHVWMLENDQGEAMVYVKVNDTSCDIEIK